MSSEMDGRIDLPRLIGDVEDDDGETTDDVDAGENGMQVEEDFLPLPDVEEDEGVNEQAPTSSFYGIARGHNLQEGGIVTTVAEKDALCHGAWKGLCKKFSTREKAQSWLDEVRPRVQRENDNQTNFHGVFSKRWFLVWDHEPGQKLAGKHLVDIVATSQEANNAVGTKSNRSQQKFNSYAEAREHARHMITWPEDNYPFGE